MRGIRGWIIRVGVVLMMILALVVSGQHSTVLAGGCREDGEYCYTEAFTGKTICNYDNALCCALAGGCPEGETNVTGFAPCAGFPSNYSVSCMPNTELGSCLSTNFRGTCQQYVPAKWGGCSGGCQINCGCCPPGQTYQCSDITSTYNVVDDGSAPRCRNYHSPHWRTAQVSLPSGRHFPVLSSDFATAIMCI